MPGVRRTLTDLGLVTKAGQFRPNEIQKYGSSVLHSFAFAISDVFQDQKCYQRRFYLKLKTWGTITRFTDDLPDETWISSDVAAILGRTVGQGPKKSGI